MNDQLSELQELVQASRPVINQAVIVACRKYLPHADPATIEDLIGRVIVHLLEDNCRRLQSFENRSQLKTWLYRMAKNVVINHASRQKISKNLDDLTMEVLAVLPCQEELVYLHEEQKIISHALQSMSEKDKKLWALLCNEDLDDHQRATVLGIVYPQFRKHNYNLINKLRRVSGGGSEYSLRYFRAKWKKYFVKFKDNSGVDVSINMCKNLPTFIVHQLFGYFISFQVCHFKAINQILIKALEK